MMTQPIHLTPKDLGRLKPLLKDVAAYWVPIADQLRMASDVPTIQHTPSNTNPPEFLRDLLYRWLNQGHPTVGSLCEALRGDSEIIGGARVATELEKEFSGQIGD